MIASRPRAFTLLEVLAVFLIVTVAGTMMTVGVASVLRAHKRTAELANRYAVLHDFLHTLRGDVRAADRLALTSEPNDAATTLKLIFDDESPELLYRFFFDRLERFGGGTDGNQVDPVASAPRGGRKVWPFEHSSATVALEQPPGRPESKDSLCFGAAPLLKVTLQWYRRPKDDTQPNARPRRSEGRGTPARRFSVTLRPTGEQRRESK